MLNTSDVFSDIMPDITIKADTKIVDTALYNDIYDVLNFVSLGMALFIIIPLNGIYIPLITCCTNIRKMKLNKLLL